MIFRPPFVLNIEYRKKFKGGCPSVNGVQTRRCSFDTHVISGFYDPAHAIWWVAVTFLMLDNSILCGQLVPPTCIGVVLFVAVERRRKLHFIQFYDQFENVRVLVYKWLEVVLHVRKGAMLGVQKVNEGRDIYSRAYSFGNGKHCQINAQHFKG